MDECAARFWMGLGVWHEATLLTRFCCILQTLAGTVVSVFERLDSEDI
jgi:hypothetical protein